MSMEYEILLGEKEEFVEERDNSRRKKKTKRDIKLRKYMKAPVKMLVKARELYVTSMNRLSDVPTFGHDVGALPRSFSANHARSVSVDKTMSELIRVASVRNMVIVETKPEGHVQQVREPSMMRNFSVGMARIEEEKPYEFSSRSKSYSVSKSSYTYASQLS